jgi:hypothetical protein
VAWIQFQTEAKPCSEYLGEDLVIRYGTEVRAVLKVKAKSNYAYLKKNICMFIFKGST